MATSTSHDGENSTMDESKEGGSEELFPGCPNITEFSQQMLKTVLQGTKMSNDLPTGDDYDYYSTYDSVRNVMDMEANRLLRLMQNIMRHQNVKGTISGTDHALELEEQFDVIMDANDQILERVGTSLDEATGVRKNEQKLVVAAVNRPNPAIASWNRKKPNTGSPSAPLQLLTAKNIERPQMKFSDKIDNSNKPFAPILRRKPHAKKSLQESLQLPSGITLEDMESPDFVFPHPYQYELDQWQPASEQLEKVTPQEPSLVDSTPPLFIDTVSDLADLVDLLKTQEEVAVDLEHHSFRSFQGIVCLMQISTRTQDFLIDTLPLRSDMCIMNEVFTDPNIVKVFHGADSDIEWLQRDFGVYVVNMFDTGQAARVLNCTRFSLAHLLQAYCQVETDKRFQHSDWRIRPLTEDMVRYAQKDTHYLLYIYDRMRCELIERGNEQKNLLQSVYQRSKNICLKVYKKARFTEDSHKELYMKSRKVFNSRQRQALKDIYAWRNKVARDEDESVQYVIPNHMLLQLAEVLPREQQGVIACCQPTPPPVRQCLHEIHSMIMQARETPLVQMEEKKQVSQPSPSQHPHYQVSITSCPHDMSKYKGDPMELDTPHKDRMSSDPIARKQRSSLFHSKLRIAVKKTSSLSALGSIDTNNGLEGTRAYNIWNSFSSPFQRFLPKTDGPQQGSTVKPATAAKVWRLKPHTVPAAASQKRKSDVDLNTFAPEFVPPMKKHHVDSSAIRASTTTKMATTPPPPQPSTSGATTSPTVTASKRTPQPGEKRKEEEEVPVEEEEVALSSRQLMKKRRKEKKAKKRALITDSLEPSTKPPTPQNTETEEKPPSTPLAPTSTEEKKKKKKKKKKERLSVTFAVEPEIPAAAAPVEEDEGEEKKKKKKKKKVKGVGEEVQENITPFDYSAADKSAVTGNTKKKIHADVYNPNFRGGDKKQKKNKGKKKDRFGAKQRKGITFSTDSGGMQRK